MENFGEFGLPLGSGVAASAAAEPVAHAVADSH